jgi:hypothetical protein
MPLPRLGRLSAKWLHESFVKPWATREELLSEDLVRPCLAVRLRGRTYRDRRIKQIPDERYGPRINNAVGSNLLMGAAFPITS